MARGGRRIGAGEGDLGDCSFGHGEFTGLIAFGIGGEPILAEGRAFCGDLQFERPLVGAGDDTAKWISRRLASPPLSVFTAEPYD